MRDEATGSSPGRPLSGKLLPGRRLAGLVGAVTVGALFIGQAGLASGATAGRGEAGLTAARAVASAAAYTPTNKTFKFGERGPGILALQQRLLRLHYFVGTLNGIFDWGTQEAVWAFKEVQSGKIAPPHPNRVDPATQRELVHPKAPPVKFPHGGALRIEVNKNIEVLVVYKDNKPELISHVSSASWCRPGSCGWFTPGGFHRALYYIPGKVPDASFGTSFMYWPVFFIGHTYAIHGFPQPIWGNRWVGVPLLPASHGCVRIPMGVSKVLHTLIHISPVDGTPIWIYPVATTHFGAKVRMLRPGHQG